MSEYKKSQSVIDAENEAKRRKEEHRNWVDYGYGENSPFQSVADQIKNRQPFSYDFNADALYNQYKNSYMQQGKMAMQDTMGQASAMTGGYGNSYAATVGNQAYQSSMQNLNNVIPELYQLAYNKYAQEGQDLYNKYDLEYGAWKDKATQLESDANYYQNEADQLYANEYSKWYAENYPETPDMWKLVGTEQYTDPTTGLPKTNSSKIQYIKDGKVVSYDKGVNPNTGTKNPDGNYGYITGSYYQPNNVASHYGNNKYAGALTPTDKEDYINGQYQTIYETPDGKKWIWDELNNEYLEYKE